MKSVFLGMCFRNRPALHSNLCPRDLGDIDEFSISMDYMSNKRGQYFTRSGVSDAFKKSYIPNGL